MVDFQIPMTSNYRLTDGLRSLLQYNNNDNKSNPDDVVLYLYTTECGLIICSSFVLPIP